MLKIFDLKDRTEYLREVAILEHNEWGSKDKNENEFENKILNKIVEINSQFKNEYFCKLILLQDDNLVGFISIFPTDGEERKDGEKLYYIEVCNK